MKLSTNKLILLSISLLLASSVSAQYATTNALISNSFYSQSSVSGLFQLMNTGTNGLLGVAEMLIVFMVLALAATVSLKTKPINAALVSSAIMVIVSTLAQHVGIVNSGMPVIFMGLTILCALGSLMSNFLSPYG